MRKRSGVQNPHAGRPAAAGVVLLLPHLAPGRWGQEHAPTLVTEGPGYTIVTYMPPRDAPELALWLVGLVTAVLLTGRARISTGLASLGRRPFWWQPLPALELPLWGPCSS